MISVANDYLDEYNFKYIKNIHSDPRNKRKEIDLYTHPELMGVKIYKGINEWVILWFFGYNEADIIADKIKGMKN